MVWPLIAMAVVSALASEDERLKSQKQAANASRLGRQKAISTSPGIPLPSTEKTQEQRMAQAQQQGMKMNDLLGPTPMQAETGIEPPKGFSLWRDQANENMFTGSANKMYMADDLSLFNPGTIGSSSATTAQWRSPENQQKMRDLLELYLKKQGGY